MASVILNGLSVCQVDDTNLSRVVPTRTPLHPLSCLTVPFGVSLCFQVLPKGVFSRKRLPPSLALASNAISKDCVFIFCRGGFVGKG
jgi:hypothetical protein